MCVGITRIVHCSLSPQSVYIVCRFHHNVSFHWKLRVPCQLFSSTPSLGNSNLLLSTARDISEADTCMERTPAMILFLYMTCEPNLQHLQYLKDTRLSIIVSQQCEGTPHLHQLTVCMCACVMGEGGTYEYTLGVMYWWRGKGGILTCVVLSAVQWSLEWKVTYTSGCLQE